MFTIDILNRSSNEPEFLGHAQTVSYLGWYLRLYYFSPSIVSPNSPVPRKMRLGVGRPSSCGVGGDRGIPCWRYKSEAEGGGVWMPKGAPCGWLSNVGVLVIGGIDFRPWFVLELTGSAGSWMWSFWLSRLVWHVMDSQEACRVG